MEAWFTSVSEDGYVLLTLVVGEAMQCIPDNPSKPLEAPTQRLCFKLNTIEATAIGLALIQDSAVATETALLREFNRKAAEASQEPTGS
jgi:hypothetical protein